jgi:hypothetical protein
VASTLLQMADHLEERGRELAHLAPRAAPPPLGQIAQLVRQVATPHGTTLLAQSLSGVSFTPGRHFEAAGRTWARRVVGERSGEAFASLANALFADIREAAERVERTQQSAPAPAPPATPTFASRAERDKAMRAMRADGASIRAVAERFGMSVARTHAICTRGDS